MKLYWRFKKNGKWTWKAAKRYEPGDYTGKLNRRYLTVEEE
jgi:hypothetical protein